MSKTRVIAVRITEEAYQALKREADKEAAGVAEHMRGLIYSYYYPTEKILKKFEENKLKFDASIKYAKEYIQEIMIYSEYLEKKLIEFKDKLEDEKEHTK